MNSLLPEFGTTTEFGLDWPTWIAAGGFVLFCLLGLYAATMLVVGKYRPERLRFLQLPTVRGRLVVGFMLAATLPAISLALVLSERTTNERLEHTATILKSQAVSIANLTDFFVHRYITDLTESAQLFDTNFETADADLTNHLLELHRGQPQMALMMIADDSGRILASTKIATTTNGGQQVTILPIPDLSLAGERYFAEPLATGAPFISGGVRHPQIDAPIAAAISVPIPDSANRVAGVLIGFFDPGGFSRAQRPLIDRTGIRSVLLDRDGRVLFASKLSGLRIAEDLTNRSVLSVPYPGPGKIFNFEAAVGDGSKTERFLAAGYTLRSGWQIFLYRPLEALELALLDEYGVALAWLVGALLISFGLALSMVRGLSGPLEALDHSIRNFDLNMQQEPPVPPPDASREVLAVFGHLASLDTRLRTTYQKLYKSVQQGEKLRGELIYVIANREREIEERTQELKEVNQTLERLSREDSLTGLANRRWFAQFLARAWQTALRDGKPLSILIIDVDDFKAYNDHYGHQKGDSCLKLVAEAIQQGVGRASDLVSRYGGEEFVVVLGDTPLEGGLKIAEQVRVAVEELGIPHDAAKCHPCVTISVGVTSALPTRDTQPETVLVAADRAMYTAKNDGKNKVAYSTTARTGTFQALCQPGDGAPRLS